MFNCDVFFILYKSGQYELIECDDEDFVIDFVVFNFSLLERIFEI